MREEVIDTKAGAGAPIPEDEDERLRGIERYSILDTPRERAFDNVVELAAQLFEAPIALVSLVDRERQWFKACVGLDIRQTDRSISFCAHAIVSDEVMVVPDACQDPRFSSNPLVVGPPGIRFYAGAPLRAPGGASVGTLCVIDTKPRATLSNEQAAVLEKLAAVVVDLLELRVSHDGNVAEIERRRAIEAELRQKTAFLSLLERVAVASNGASTVEEALGFALDETCKHAGWPVGHALMTRDGELVSGGVWHLDDPDVYRDFRHASEQVSFRHGETFPGQVLATGAPLWKGDVLADPGFVRAEVARRSGLRAWFAFPVLVGSEVAGVLEFFAPQGRALTEEFLDVMFHVGTQLGRVVERKRAEAEIEAARVAAEEANRAKSEFLSRMSHELRTPLNAILGFGQLLEMEGLSPEQHQSVREIIKGGRHLLDLINEVLDISRIEIGELALSLEPVPAADVIEESVALLKPLAAQRGIMFDVRLPAPSRSWVLADRQRLKQVLLNLVANAVKYNRDEGQVAISGSAPDGTFTIEVRDTGGGIPPDKLRSLFTPFQRLGAERTEVEGTGLGLALSKRLVEAMGGSIFVSSAPGRGCTFSVELAQVDPPLDALVLEEDETVASGVHEEVRTILYIEDNTANIRLIEQVLALRGSVKVVSAMQASTGIMLARQHQPDLILLDLNLPDMNGFDVLGRLRSDPATGHIPVVVLSADATERETKRLMNAGAHRYLTKPIAIKPFLEVVDELLGART